MKIMVATRVRHHAAMMEHQHVLRMGEEEGSRLGPRTIGSLARDSKSRHVTIPRCCSAENTRSAAAAAGRRTVSFSYHDRSSLCRVGNHGGGYLGRGQ